MYHPTAMSDGEASNTQLNREAVMIDKTRVVGDLLFATHPERAWYLGRSGIEQRRWLREHPGRWWRIEDLQQEAAPPGPPSRARSISEPYQLGRTLKRHPVVFRTTAAMKMTSPWSILRPETARLRTSRHRYPQR